MKYAKILILAIIIAVFIYYKFSKDNTILLEDKLSMFLLVKMHDDIDDILFDLSSQIKSFDEYIHNVYYIRDNDFLINKKSRLQFDLDYVNYKSLLTCSDISDFNIEMGALIEENFLNHNSSFHLTKRYLIRDFLVRFKTYFKHQTSLFNKFSPNPTLEKPLENFILGSKYITDHKQENYIMRIEFSDLESMNRYHKSGMDSVLNSILDYNSKVFNSDLLLYNPMLDSAPIDLLEFQLRQYVNEFDSLDEAVKYHQDLILSDNVHLIESVYDYYFKNTNDMKIETLKLSKAVSDSTYQINYLDYKNSLLILEEKLITLQSDDLTDDDVIQDILIELVGDGNKSGFFSNYIDMISLESDYMVENLNRLFIYELNSLFSQIDQAESKFDILDLPQNIRDHLFANNKYKVKYFVK